MKKICQRTQQLTLILFLIFCHAPRLRTINAFTASNSKAPIRKLLPHSLTQVEHSKGHFTEGAADDPPLPEDIDSDDILLGAEFLADENDDHSSDNSKGRQGNGSEEQGYQDDRESDVQNFARNPEWLEAATAEILDLGLYPLGHLTPDDIEYITSLIIAWSRRLLPDGPTKLEALLKRVVDDMKAGNRDVSVSTTMYTAAMEAWGKSGAKGRAARAQNIHDALLHEYRQTSSPLIAPSVLSFNTLMNAWAKSGESDIPERVEYVLKQLCECEVDGKVLVPDAVSISTMLDAYSRSGDQNGINVTRCEELFEMADRWNVTKTLYTYSTLQNVYARSGSPEGAKKAFGVLELMWDRYHKGDVLAKPNSVNYNAVLNAASRSPTPENAALADGLLRRMEAPHPKGDDVEPDRLSFALTILACSRCTDPLLGVETAVETLERMEARARQEEKRRRVRSSAAPAAVRLDVECFNVVLTALSRLNQIDIVDRMQEIIDRMERYAAVGVSSVRPNVRTWNALLNGMARQSRSRSHSYADEAEALLYRMFEMHKSGLHNNLPNSFSFAAVLTTMQRCPTASSVTERADRILRMMEEYHEKGLIEDAPDVYHYTIVCGVWAKSRLSGASDRCVQILGHMMERSKQGYKNTLPNTRTLNAALDCFARNRQAERAEQLIYHMLDLARRGQKNSAPDTFSWNSAIHAVLRSNLKDAGRRAESILERFLEYAEEEDPQVTPDVRSFAKLISYYGKSKRSGPAAKNTDACYRAEYILNRMLDLYKSGSKGLAPPAYCICTVMDAYSHAKHPDAGRNAERLLRLAKSLEADPNAQLEIDRNIMNSVLFAWANCGDTDAGREASAHLEEMEQEYKNGNAAMQPDSRTYSLALSAWATTSSPDKAQKVLSIIESMKQQASSGNTEVVLNEHHFALAINACAFANSSIEVENAAFKIAVSLFEQVVQSDQMSPTSLTYGWFIQCCGRLRVPEIVRDAHIERAFKLCCDDGLVTDFVVRRLQGAASEDVFESLMVPAGITKKHFRGKIPKSSLPAEWTRTNRPKRKNTV